MQGEPAYDIRWCKILEKKEVVAPNFSLLIMYTSKINNQVCENANNGEITMIYCILLWQ